MKIRQWGWRWGGRILYALVLAFVGWYIFKNARSLWAQGVHFSGLALALSLAASFAGHLANLAVWQRLAASFGLHEGFITTGKAWLVSRLGRHVPGKVTILLVRFNLYQGHPKNAIAAATVTEYVATLASAGFVVSLAFYTSSMALPPGVRALSALLSIGLVAALSPRFLPKALNLVFRIAKRNPPETYPPFALVLRFVAAYMIPALLHGLAFFLLIRALYPVEAGHFLVIAGIYYGASLIGLAALFAPGGIGVREGILFLLLPALLPEPVVVTAAIGIRLVNSGTEAALAGVFSGLARCRDRFHGGNC